ncbi:MAG: hypothetical protein R3321_08935 [Nitrososphaeraceae archaeon]|nr:hypothetical protein [Nitrososphaeraceae archaeon]
MGFPTFVASPLPALQMLIFNPPFYKRGIYKTWLGATSSHQRGVN